MPAVHSGGFPRSLGLGGITEVCSSEILVGGVAESIYSSGFVKDKKEWDLGHYGKADTSDKN